MTEGFDDTLKSLQRLALSLLSRREHTRLELKTKLQKSNRAAEAPLDEDAMEALLARLEAQGYLSDARAAEMIVRQRADKRGVARIVAELELKGVDPVAIETLTAPLKDDELPRARVVWQKKFAQKPQNPREYAQQGRFLASRGFSASVIHRLLGGRDDDAL